MTTTTEPQHDLLEGMNEKTTKSKLLDRLNEGADVIDSLRSKLRRYEKARTGRLGEIEKRVREKYKPGDLPALHKVIISATDEEWQDAQSFLAEFEDLLPAALHRLSVGGKHLVAELKEEKAAV